MASSSRVLTDHDEIREWAESRGATPSAVKRTESGDDVGIIRLDFPGYSGADSLEEISWDDWFDKFEETKLALLVQDELAEGGQSNFNKLIGRETAAAADRGEKTSRRAARGQGIAKGGGTTAKKRQSASRGGSSS